MNGKWIRFPTERRIVLDILAAARTVPAFPVDRWFHLERVRDARHRSMHRISWTSIFLRGWGLTCQQVPDLRRIYLSFPWGHFYEHPQSVASVSVHRREPNASSDQLIFSRIMCPEGKTLLEIQSILDAGKRDPIPQAFPDGERLKHMPWPIRRFVWMLLMRVWGKRKAKTIGTFTISSLAGQNASNHFHRSSRPQASVTHRWMNKDDAWSLCYAIIALSMAIWLPKL